MRSRTNRVRTLVAVCAAVGLVAVGCTAQGDGKTATVPSLIDKPLPEATISELQGAVENAITTANASGAIVGVWAPWSGSWVTGVGTATPEGGEISTDMRFRATTITRPMICDAMYKVAAEGTIALDDTVSTWVSGVADAEVTLEQLCASTSGLSSYKDKLMPYFLSNPERQWQARELVTYGLSGADLSAAGTAYQDSDAGYVLLGLALERATGKDAASLLEEYVFSPLNLSDTALPAPSAVLPAEGEPTLPGLYTENDEAGAPMCAAPRDATTLSTSVGYTDSGVVSTIYDLGRYTQALALGAVVPKSAGRFDDQKPPTERSPAWFNTGGGAYITGGLVGQFGSLPGYSTVSFSDPVSGLTVAAVLNNSRASSAVMIYLGWELAAIASKAPGNLADPPEGLPWTAEQYHDAVTSLAVCPPAAEEPAPEG